MPCTCLCHDGEPPCGGCFEELCSEVALHYLGDNPTELELEIRADAERELEEE